MSKTTERVALLERQIERVQRRYTRLQALRRGYFQIQVIIVLAGFFVCSSTFALSHWLSLCIVIFAVIAFVFVARFERKIGVRLPLYFYLSQTLEQQIARIRLDWDALPSVQARDSISAHPFDADLDITGERSLHQLLNTAVSSGGTERLRQWLLSRSPDLETIRQRQTLVRELIPLTRFRNQFLLYSFQSTRLDTGAMEAKQVVDWLKFQNASETRQRRSTLIIALILSSLIYIFIALSIFASFSFLFVVAALLPPLIWYLLTSKEQGNLAGDTFSLQRTLWQLDKIFTYLEKYPYARNSGLYFLCEPFFGHGDRNPSLMLKHLKNITRRAGLSRQNGFWLALNVLFPVGAYTAYQLDGYKAQLLHYLPTWLDTWYELEALCSLATFAYLHPDYTMPELLANKIPDDHQQPVSILFQARALGHPLIDKEHKVTNDITIDKLSTIVMITGSNMAGKSTFLRTMGINLCLAYAGSVVNARSLRTSLFELYACIRVTDSLADGYSYFYAEVRRLKGLLDRLAQATSLPLFFLIDEIFKGTNNYERLIGSESYIHALAGKNCVGAISTHDLELVKLADFLPGIRNMHFREDVIDGRMVFNYLLRNGPSPTRNALKIMELEGLPVKWNTQTSRLDQ